MNSAELKTLALEALIKHSNFQAAFMIVPDPRRLSKDFLSVSGLVFGDLDFEMIKTFVRVGMKTKPPSIDHLQSNGCASRFVTNVTYFSSFP